jgi:hypothetical protein
MASTGKAEENNNNAVAQPATTTTATPTPSLNADVKLFGRWYNSLFMRKNSYKI